MRRLLVRRCFAPVLLVVAVGACDRDPALVDGSAGDGATGAAAPSASEPAAANLPAVDLSDVVESTPDYIIGISYPQSVANYPALAAVLKRYADAARDDLMQAVAARTGEEAMLYDLSLSFTEVLETPSLVAYAADGSMYTGGAHGMPLVERFVWLPQQRQPLTAHALVPGREGWNAIAGYVREQLHAALSQRVDAADLPPQQRAALLDTAGGMIEDGTAPDPANYARFEPVARADGKLVALRFVFPPYQVGPYSDGTQSVEVPAAVLLPHVAPQYRELFAPRGALPPPL